MMAATTTLLTGITHAQIVHPQQHPQQQSAPGWSEFHDLSARLAAVEAENRWLKDEISRSNEEAVTGVEMSSHENQVLPARRTVR
jgi:hypothetical protein